MTKSGSLVVVGSGIKFPSHMTTEAQLCIERADKLFFLTSSEAAEQWLVERNAAGESLDRFYAKGKRRIDTYLEMVAHVLTAVYAGNHVCVLFYGHPGIFVWPSHELIRQARAAGFPTVMLPGISAEDCLFADLGIDPAREGCQSYEATDFLVRNRQIDTSAGLVLWQVGVVGNLTPPTPGAVPSLPLLKNALLLLYDPTHLVYIYEAAQVQNQASTVQCVALADLNETLVTAVSTLYIPPAQPAQINLDMLQKLGLSIDDIQFSETSG
ncbi:SAM-dependent methyltransferase [Candidatus Leptofilum sp.]|uniref:SAM-dependent methyltransferase n=1 Tax=Candidatus Leptofilum sp. TaxID=3241576 RepID=UPI003B59B60E